ncbi:MAG: CDP-diacylglycerol--serine O-phosphatidyltransferase [Candidatus Aminicenantes bacterium]|nr:CDP-diacylglycerol--serine O-phosphatidyltransferase [Candidatus Aminicenantes bacterium]NIM83026.1 CDP-diacylglycerol--serine O-phosphatidyltransferase [Candidatus Aminicenantes bacterium]NIN22413.1 CDP-diacylglycerol--serine O-phosphatidyltransferase [Candidatus Aminicenantes bacterium]NIN46181.1 CDP-diacylglycerol--serine O-phosphatidyltransferase [Candidatus Aminicenantes bacterium]NIN89018.1 CDP-diacylglycerol--serine O-phosphatidyltransferase [Candidatus Aminicenantes bacterium]
MEIFKSRFYFAVLLMTGSVILDGFDGTVARLTKTESNFGVQLDSLVDAVTFGLVASVMIYMWGFQNTNPPIGQVIGFIFLSAGVIRLARFNVLKEAKAQPSNVFVGLPIPIGALAIASVVLVFETPLEDQSHVTIFAFYVLLVSLLMVSSIRYRTMKKMNSKNNLLVLFLAAIIIAIAIKFPTYTIPTLTLLYMISPLLFYVYNKVRKYKAPTVPIESVPDKVGES